MGDSSRHKAIQLYQTVITAYNASVTHVPTEFHPTSTKLALIIDPRLDEITMGVIKNFMHFMCPAGWNFMFMTYDGHRDTVYSHFPTCIFQAIEDKYIQMENGMPNMNIESYNEILLSYKLWGDIIPAKYQTVCIFQRDCIMYRMFSSEFENYAFAGANFYDHVNSDIFWKCTSFYNGGINGGFSIRNRQTMCICLSAIQKESIQEYRRIQMQVLMSRFEAQYKISQKRETDIMFGIQNEDVYFTNACEILGFHMPDILHRSKLAIETDMVENTAVYHGWDKGYQTYKDALSLLKDTELFAPFCKDIVIEPIVVQTIESKTLPIITLPDSLRD